MPSTVNALAATCLRQLAMQSMPTEKDYWKIISPKRLATVSWECPLLPLQSEGALRQRLHEHAEQPTLQQAGNRHRQPDSRLRPTTYYRARSRTPVAPEEQIIRTERLQTSGCRVWLQNLIVTQKATLVTH